MFCFSDVTVIVIPDVEIVHPNGGKRTHAGLDVGIAQGTGETDMLIESAPQIEGDAEVEIETTETGETILLIELEDAAGTLLTHGPVVEVTPISESPW